MTNRRFGISLLILLGLALVLVWIGRGTNADLYLADAMFDFHAMAFPRRDLWFYNEFMHHAMKALMVCAGLVPFGVLLADRCAGSRFAGRGLVDAGTRRKLLVVAAAAILIPLAISAMKSMSIHHCPWSLTRYGGFAPYQRIFDSLLPGVSHGHCFPAGHASGGLWLASIAVFWLPERPLRALAAFAAGLVPGLMMGLAQQMRGAHFLTHTLWSVWIAALVVLVLAQLFLRTSTQAG